MAKFDTNTTTFIGHLGSDPRSVGNGEPRVLLNVAVGGGENKTTWVSVTAFGTTAENCLRYLARGKQVCVHGRLSSYRRDLDGGRWRDELSVAAQQVQFLSPPDDAGANPRTAAADPDAPPF